MAKCLRSGCDREVFARGLCRSCYQIAWRLVKKGRTTWEQLELIGLSEHPEVGRGPGFTSAFKEALLKFSSSVRKDLVVNAISEGVLKTTEPQDLSAMVVPPADQPRTVKGLIDGIVNDARPAETDEEHVANFNRIMGMTDLELQR